MKIIVPMAGLGTRFQKVCDKNPEYKKPKPFINIKGWPMVHWALASLPFLRHHGENVEAKHLSGPEDLIFIILKAHNDEHKIEAKLKEIYSDKIRVIILPEVTRGAAETAYSALKYVNPEEDIVITDSDHFFDGNNLAEMIHKKDANTAGIIPVFRARNEGIPKWSYSLIKPNTNFISKVAEKDRALMEAGALANIGAYYFSKGKYFFDIAGEIIHKGQTFGEAGKAEFYIAPLYQILIDRGFKVQAAIIPEVWGLGTPEDLEYFLKNYKTNRSSIK
jgi:NDP-sugar pyrophosphorylase family protein